jgi:protein involved in polysaccharide export with SLBB domain
MSSVYRFRLLLLFAAAFNTGCAAVTNTVADGIPVRRLPVEVLGRPKADLKPIPLTLLRQRELDPYVLDKGDVLAVVADDVVAPAGSQVPYRQPDQFNSLAAVGFPIPVNDDGTISIPRLKPINVRGKTLAEVEQLIKDVAGGKTGGPQLINPDLARVTVQLLQKRIYSITVVREDTQPVAGGTNVQGGQVLGGNKKGNGFTLKLQAGENDVLRALNATGGPPGLDARDEILIFRGTYDPAKPEQSITRIPLRIYPEQQLTICEADIILRDGDVVKIESRDTSTEVYYVAGVAGSRPFQLPRDYDLDVIQALTQVGAPLQNGGFSQTQFNGNAVTAGLGTPTPALLTVLRQLPNNQQIAIRVDLGRAFRDPRERIRVLGGDILVMQERPGDAVTRYLYQTFRFNTALGLLGNNNGGSSLNSTAQFP